MFTLTALYHSHAMLYRHANGLNGHRNSKSRPETNHLWRMVITDISAVIATHTATFFRFISKLVGISNILFYND